MSSDNSNLRALVETLAPLAMHDATLARMLKMKRPLTIATYLRMEYPEGVPPLTGGVLDGVPAPLLGAVNPENEEDGFRSRGRPALVDPSQILAEPGSARQLRR